ncbi:MAG TPA: hypothetical protein VMY99_00705 [Nevskiaceae bacterium]|nr:hypothetical protein [Nevskiaceae bacterium]
MHFARKAALLFVTGLLPLTLFSFGLFLSLRMVFGTPHPIESALERSDIYSVAVQDALKQAQQKEPASSDVPLTRPEIQAAIQKAFPPQLLQQNTTHFLDSTYAWLQGKDKNLSFTIDLTQAKVNLANYMGDYVAQRVTQLPQCTSVAQLSGTVDPYNATCVPKGFDTNIAVLQAKQDILSNKGFLENPVLTASTIKNDQGETLQQQLEAGPRAYKRVMTGIVSLGILAAALGVAAVFLHDSRRAGLKRVSIIAIVVGLSSALVAFAASLAAQRISDKVAASYSNNGLQSKMADIVQLLVNDVRAWWLGFGITLALLGVGILVALTLTRNNAQVHAKSPEPSNAKPSAEAGDHPEQPAKSS